MPDTNETLMTPAAENAPAAAPASDATPAAPPTGDGNAAPQPAADPAAQPAQGDPAANPDPAKAPEKQDPVAGAPDTYEFTKPEGTADLDTAVIEQFAAVAKELNLPQDQAQKIIDRIAPVMQARQAEQLGTARTQWADAARTDKEFGGDKLQENLAVAKKAMDAFASPELRSLLNDSGLGNHPEVIRLMYRAGKAISEDQLVTGRVAGAESKSAAQVLYDKSAR